MGRPRRPGLSLPVSGPWRRSSRRDRHAIERYRLTSGRTGYHNKSAPQVPVSVAPQIEGILGLDTLSPAKPSTAVPQSSQVNPRGRFVRCGTGACPRATTPQPGACFVHQRRPDQYRRSDAVQCRRRTPSTRSIPPTITGPGPRWPVRCRAPATARATSRISAMLRHHPPGRAAHPGGHARRGCDRVGHRGGGARHKNVLSLAPQANIKVYEGGASDSIYSVLSRIVSDDTEDRERQLDERVRALCPQSYMNSENTLFQAAAAEGQSVFVATGDEGSQGCNINGAIAASTGGDPDRRGRGFLHGHPVHRQQGQQHSQCGWRGRHQRVQCDHGELRADRRPRRRPLDRSIGRVFVANSGGTLTVFSTSTCKQSTTSGCGSPTGLFGWPSLHSGGTGHERVDVVRGARSSNTVAVYSVSASTTTWVATVTLRCSGNERARCRYHRRFRVRRRWPQQSSRVFRRDELQRQHDVGVLLDSATVTVGHDPVALTVASGAGDLYVANAGSGGGVTVVSLSTHAVVKTISTSEPLKGKGLVQSIGIIRTTTKCSQCPLAWASPATSWRRSTRRPSR